MTNNFLRAWAIVILLFAAFADHPKLGLVAVLVLLAWDVTIDFGTLLRERNLEKLAQRHYRDRIATMMLEKERQKRWVDVCPNCDAGEHSRCKIRWHKPTGHVGPDSIYDYIECECPCRPSEKNF